MKGLIYKQYYYPATTVSLQAVLFFYSSYSSILQVIIIFHSFTKNKHDNSIPLRMNHFLYASPDGTMYRVVFGTSLEMHPTESQCECNIFVSTTTSNRQFWSSIMINSVSLRKATTTINISIERLYLQALLLSCYYRLTWSISISYSSYSLLL